MSHFLEFPPSWVESSSRWLLSKGRMRVTLTGESFVQRLSEVLYNWGYGDPKWAGKPDRRSRIRSMVESWTKSDHDKMVEFFTTGAGKKRTKKTTASAGAASAKKSAIDEALLVLSSDGKTGERLELQNPCSEVPMLSPEGAAQMAEWAAQKSEEEELAAILASEDSKRGSW